MQQNKLNFERACDLKTPRTLEPILPAVCEKTFSASFVPQPVENHTLCMRTGACKFNFSTDVTQKLKNAHDAACSRLSDSRAGVKINGIVKIRHVGSGKKGAGRAFPTIVKPKTGYPFKEFFILNILWFVCWLISPAFPSRTYSFFFFFWSGEGDRFRFFSFPTKNKNSN